MKKTINIFLLSTSFLSIAAPVFAQDNIAEENVIITATRRAEKNIKNIPISLNVLNSKQLENGNAQRLIDLVQLDPSFQLPQSESAMSITARIRGIGTQGTNFGLEPSVGVVIDGVPRSRTNMAYGALLPIESAEIIRGPQSTLFGRNTSAGIIAINTKKPNLKAIETNAALSLGNYNLVDIGGYISAPLKENLAGSLYYNARARDGFVNVNNGTSAARKDNSQDYFILGGQLLYKPSENGEIRFIYDISSREDVCCNALTYVSDSRVPVNSTALLNRISANSKLAGNQYNSFNSVTDRDFGQRIHENGASLEAKYKLNIGTLTSITASRYYDFAYAQDGEWSGADILYRDLSERPGGQVKTLSQEVRLNGEINKLNWLIGVFYLNEEINSHNIFRYGKDYETYIGGLLSGASAATIPVSQFIPNLRGLINSATNGSFNLNTLAMTEGGGWSDYFTQRSNSFSIFTHNIYNLNDKTALSFGVRYTNENKDFNAKYETTGSAGCKAIEQTYGFNPSANAPSNLAGVVGTVCVPWARSALDNTKHVQKFKDDQFSGNLSLSYKLYDNLTSYASFAHGYKAGGFNLDRVMVDDKGTIVSGAIGNQTIRQPDTSFAPETVDSYEIGLKGNWFNNKFIANLALFNAEYKNFQLNTYNGISQIVASVPKVYSRGFELDYKIKTHYGLSFNGGLAFADAVYTRKLGAPNDSASFLGKNLNLYLIGGQQLTASPKWTAVHAINYSRDLGEFKFNGNINHRHVSSINGGSNLDPRKSIPEMDLFNGNISIAQNNWSLELWGKNITNEKYPQIVFDGPLQGNSPLMAASGTTRAITSQIDAFPADPKTFGLTLRIKN